MEGADLSACVMVLPDPVGILSGDALTRSLIAAPRWDSVVMDDRHCALVSETAVLAYRANAKRAEAAPYRALCSSTYAKVEGAWRIIQHQQMAL